jgi:phosphatidylethanolamine/phosphatidyl-N-methylethanolamine N-methyltransferase
MMNQATTSRTYDLWSKFYDVTFHPLVRRRMHRAITELRLRPGDRVLDVGVGTGLSLESLPPNIYAVGVDISGGMLRQAGQKLERTGRDHVHLVQADALLPPFVESSFDHVLISHVVSVVSDPVKLMRWVARMLKPNGRVVIVNHFRSTHRLMGWLETALNPVCKQLGWRTDLSLHDLVADGSLRLDYQFKLTPLDLWQIVVMSPPLSKPFTPAEPDRPGAETIVPAGPVGIDAAM